MSAAAAAMNGTIDPQRVLKQYEKLTAIKNGSIFDIVDIPFNGSELTFFYRLTSFFQTEEDPSMEEDRYHLAMLSTLIYFSSKIHFSISEKNATEQAMRQKLQFPVLVGDLLYSLFFAEIIQGPYDSKLDDYIEQLICFNADMVDYLEQQLSTEEVLTKHIGSLARLTIEILLPHATDEEYQLAERIGRFESALLLHEPFDENLFDFKTQESLLQALKQDSQMVITSLGDLTDYLTTN